MLNEFQPRLAKFPLEHGYPAIPATWKNFHRFWPVPVYLARKTLSKVVRIVIRRGTFSTPRSDHFPERLQLWGEEEVRELLDPATMKLACLVDSNALSEFLKSSQQKGFPFNDQWARLLSIEYTLRVLEKAKKELVACGLLR